MSLLYILFLPLRFESTYEELKLFTACKDCELNEIVLSLPMRN